MSKVNMIRLQAKPDARSELEAFLVAGGTLVEQSEPQTQRWYALSREGGDELAIFDVFPDQAGRQAHFDGPVAAALAEKSATLVEGGWPGVLENVCNMVALAEHVADESMPVGSASYITLTAAPGKAAELEAFLTAGRDQVADTEPETLYWAALKSEDSEGHFAIFDLFADAEGRAKHFAGAVAKALSDKAGDLIAGGWEDGVLAKVRHFDVRAAVRR